MASLFSEVNLVRWPAVVLIGFGLSAILVGITIHIAQRFGFVDRANSNTGNPGGAALGGGIAIVLTIVVLVLVLVDGHAGVWRVLVPVIGGCLLGLWDDITRLSPLTKAVGQACCAVLYTALAGMDLRWAAPTVIFLILASNSWNVVDVMDSLLGWIGVLCLTGVAVVMLFGGLRSTGLPVVALIAASATAGFLIWNRPPAKILMGDAGSIALGMLYGILVVEGFFDGGWLALTLVLPGLIPFLEVGFLIIQRSISGVPFYQTTPDHFALRMIHNHYSVSQIIRPVILAGTGLSALACLLTATSFHGSAVIGTLAILLPALLWAYRFFNRLPAGGPIAKVTFQRHE